jgi:hypothetical protein
MTDLERLRSVPEKGATEITGFPVKTLQNWRALRKGPAYYKVGRSVRYRVGDLLDFMENCRVDPGAVPRRGRPGR